MHTYAFLGGRLGCGTVLICLEKFPEPHVLEPHVQGAEQGMKKSYAQ